MADSDAPAYDTWDAMRARTFDSYDKSGQPDENLDSLLGALGAYGKPRDQQVAALQAWLESAAARPAPPMLLLRVRGFINE